MSNLAYKQQQNNYPKAAPFMPAQGGAGQQQPGGVQQQQQQPPTGGQYSNPQQQQRGGGGGPNPSNMYSNAQQQQSVAAPSNNTSNTSSASSSTSANTNPSGGPQQQQASRGGSGPGGPPQSSQQPGVVSQQQQPQAPQQQPSQQPQITYMTAPPPPFSHPEQMYQQYNPGQQQQQQMRVQHMMHQQQQHQLLSQQQQHAAAAAAAGIPGAYLAYQFQMPPGGPAGAGGGVGPAGAQFHPHPGMPGGGAPPHHMYGDQQQFQANMVNMYHHQQQAPPQHGAPPPTYYPHQMPLPFIPVPHFFAQNMQQQQLQQQQQQQQQRDPSTINNRDAKGQQSGASSLLQQVPGQQQATYQINTGQQPLIASAAPYNTQPSAGGAANPLLPTLPPNYQTGGQPAAAAQAAHLAMIGQSAPNPGGPVPVRGEAQQATQQQPAAFLPPASISQNPAYHQPAASGGAGVVSSQQPTSTHPTTSQITPIMQPAPIIAAPMVVPPASMLPPAPQPTLTKRVRNPLAIIDPTTKKPLTLAPATTTAATASSTPAAENTNTTNSATTTTTTPAVAAPVTIPSNTTSNKPSSHPTPTTSTSGSTPSTQKTTTESTTNNTSQPEKSQPPSSSVDTKGGDLQAQVLRNMREQNKTTTTNTSSAATNVPVNTSTTTTTSEKPASSVVPPVATQPTAPAPTPVSSAPKPISYSSIAASQPVAPPPSAAVPKTAPVTQPPPSKTAAVVATSSSSVKPDVKSAAPTLVKEDRSAAQRVSGGAPTQQNVAQQNKQQNAHKVVDVEPPTKEPVVSSTPTTTTSTTTNGAITTTTTVKSDNKENVVVVNKSATTVSEEAVVTHSQKQPEPPVVAVKQQTTPSVDSSTRVTQPTSQVEQNKQPASTTPTSSVAAAAAAVASVQPQFWTPENKDGRKQYDREFLLSLRDKKLSKVMPEAIKTMDIMAINNQPNKFQQQGGMGGGGGYHSMGKGSYGGSSSYQHHIGGMGGGSASMGGPDMPGGGHYGATKSDSMKKYPQNNKHMMKGPRGSMDTRYQQQPHQVEINLNKDLQLKRTENPYIVKAKMSAEQIDEHEELLREVRNILNKLTPQNLKKLTGDLIALPINTEDRLRDSIDVIFEKSIDEQVFSQTYANLCNVLAVIKVQSTKETADGPMPTVTNFRTLLLTRCQREFDTDYLQSINYEELQKEINECTDETKKRELKEICQDKLNKAKRRSLGNIRFIGELFKLNMLTESIMYDCIERLLKQDNDEENLECLCKLLTTIGRSMDKPGNAAKMKNYFDRLDRISKKKDSVSARIRFMILDIIDLRKNNWVPRRKDNNPRRIEEIRKEAEEEQQRQEAELAKQQLHGQYNKGSQQGQRGGGGQRYQQNQGQGMQGMGNSLSKSSSMDSEAYRASKQNGNVANKLKEIKTLNFTKNNNTDLVLGPSGSSFAWGNKAPTAAAAAAKPPATLSSTSNADSSSTGGGLTSSQSFATGKPYAAAAAASTTVSSKSSTGSVSDMPKGIKKTDSLSSTGSTSASNSRDTSRASSTSRGQSGTAAPLSPKSNKSSAAKQDYTEDEIDRKANLLVEEYITNNDLNDTLKDIEEFQPIDPDQVRLFVERLISGVLERNDQYRQACGTLIYQALKHEKFDEAMVVGALKGALEMAEDLSIDVPKINVYISQILAPLIAEDLANPIKLLHEACEEILSKQLCGEIICEALHSAANRIGQSAICGLFRRARLSLRDFLVSYDNQADQDELIQKKNVQWALNTSGERERTESASGTSTSSSLEAYERKLGEIFANATTSNEVLFERIETEFDPEALKSKLFIRALAIQLIKNCYTTDKLDAALLKTRNAILLKHVNKREECELEVVYAVQALDHRLQHPAGLIRLLFDILYDEDIIPEEVFYRWRSEEREEGHSIAALATKGFFDWLAEPEDPQTTA